MKVEIPGCDVGLEKESRAVEDRRRGTLSRGKGLVAGFADCQKNEKGVFLARTSLASRESWYEAGAVGLGTQQAKLRGNRREVALPGCSLPNAQLKTTTAL